MRTSLDSTHAVVETIHGVSVADPYRWLEDRASEATECWICDQKTRLDRYFEGLGTLQSLRNRVTELVDIESVDQVGKVKNRYFYRKRGVAQQQASIFVMESGDHCERLLVDSSLQDPFVAVRIFAISADASLLAYEVKRGGEHTKAIHLVDVNTGSALSDHLKRGLARGLIFRGANDGFYYCHEFADDPAVEQKDNTVCFHRLGSSPGDDLALLTLPRTPQSKLVLTHDGEMLGAIYCHERFGHPFVDFYCSRQDQDAEWRCICRNEPAPFSPFFYGGRLFAHRFQGTENGEIVELSISHGQPIGVIVPEWNARVKQCSIVENLLYVSYLLGTETVVRMWSFSGEFVGTLPLSSGKTWGLIPGYTNDADELFLHMESFDLPPTVIRYQPGTGERIVWNQRLAPTSLASVATRRLTYPSADGTEIGLVLVGLPDDSSAGPRPMIMTAYGGFGITMTPQFSAFLSILLELGFLFALPQIRGGGERGKQWHEAARRRNRQTAFDDFIAAAEWLSTQGFTSPQKLAIFGGSNSGTLVGAAMTQRPDLFRAVLCIAPLLDMVRYHLFDRARGWAEEYGTADDPMTLALSLNTRPTIMLERKRIIRPFSSFAGIGIRVATQRTPGRWQPVSKVAPRKDTPF